jgi:hypothetical protein
MYVFFLVHLFGATENFEFIRVCVCVYVCVLEAVYLQHPRLFLLCRQVDFAFVSVLVFTGFCCFIH